MNTWQLMNRALGAIKAARPTRHQSTRQRVCMRHWIELRTQRGISAQLASAQMGWGLRHLLMLEEASKPLTLDELQTMADFLDITPRQLLMGDVA